MMDVRSGGNNARVVAVETTDSMQKVSNFYKSELERKGWKTEGTFATDQMTMYTTTKDGRKLMVSITSDGKNQTVTQTLTDK